MYIKYANLSDGMFPDLSLNIILNNALLKVHPVNHVIRSCSDYIDLYQMPLDLDTLLKCSLHLLKISNLNKSLSYHRFY